MVRHRFIGDTLLTVPFLRNLREAYPDAVIDVLVGPYSGEVLTHCPYINELLYFDTSRKHRYENLGSDGSGQSFWTYVSQIRKKRYDAAFVLKRSLSSAALVFLAGIPNRIGFNTECRSLLLTKAVPYNLERPEADCFQDLLRAVKIPVQPYPLEAWWNEDEEAMAAAMAEKYEGRRNVLIHLSSSNPAKQWTEAASAQLAAWLLESQPEQNVTLHCLGAASDAPLYEALRRSLSVDGQQRLLNWCGHTGLLESLAFIRKMDFVVGVDSGTLHMAAAVGVPVVALFGPMDERKWGPWAATEADESPIPHQVVTAPVDCRPCNLKIPCTHEFQCMTTLSVEKVKAACTTLLNS